MVALTEVSQLHLADPEGGIGSLELIAYSQPPEWKEWLKRADSVDRLETEDRYLTNAHGDTGFDVVGRWRRVER